MTDLTAKTGQMRDFAKDEVDPIAPDFQALIDRLKKTVAALADGVWLGEAGQKFNDQFLELEPHLNNVRDLFPQIAEQLRRSADAYEQTDSGVAGGIGVDRG
jgi:WXG100 family type VII secretion target